MNIQNYLEENSYPEIICLNETKLGKKIDFQIDGYFCGARREPTDCGGKHGSMILVKNDIEVIELDFLHDQFREEVIGIEICGIAGRPAFNVVTYYNPPGQKVNPKIFDKSMFAGKKTLISGDLNCKNKTWGSNSTDNLGTHLKGVIDDENWIVLNDGSKTRCDPITGREEVLDIIMCSPNMTNYNPSFFVGDDVGSDHYPIHIGLSFGYHRSKNPIYYRNPAQTEWPLFRDLVNQEICNLREPQSREDLDIVAGKLTSLVKEAYEASCPLRKKRESKKPITPLIMDMIKEKRKLRRKKSANMAKGEWLAAQSIQKEMNKISGQIKKAQKIEEKERLDKACAELVKENNPQKFFQSVNKLTGNKKNAGVSFTRKIKDELGNIASTAQERVDLFASRLARVHTTPDCLSFDDGWKISVERYIKDNPDSYTTHPLHNYLTPEDGDDSSLVATPTEEEIMKHLKKCRVKSAAGLDGIGYNLLRRVPQSYMTYLISFFGVCLRLGYFPKEWKHAKIIMVPKPGKDLSLAKNYRPISLLSCLGKLFERLLAGRLSEHLEEKGLFNKNQSGFRRGKMTSDQLLRFVEESHLGLKKGQATACLFLDAEAAFDKCWHDGVRYKFKTLLHLPTRTIRILSSFLTERTLQVFENNLSSNTVSLQAGTPQGSCLSPLIYIISVNDLPTGERHGVSQYQFADDIAARGNAASKMASVKKLQKAVDDIEWWCRKWRVKLNGEKSNLMVICKSDKKCQENLCILLFNDVIRPVSKAKFLGVEINENLNFKEHVQNLTLRAEKRLNMLKILAWGGTDSKILIRLYKTYCRSIFEYGCVSFVQAPDSVLEIMQRFQNKAIRVALRLPRYVRIDLLHKFASLPTIKERLHSLASSLLSRMMTNNELIKKLVEDRAKETYSQSYRSPLDVLLPAKARGLLT